MKERITDEVNSATNKLQSMQLIDNLALTLGQTGRTDHLVNNHQQPSSSTNSTTATTTINNNINSSNRTHQPFSLIDDNPMDDEELNSELSSPQQLFNEFTIPRKLHLQSTNNDLLLEQSNPNNVGTKAILEKPAGPIKTDTSLSDLSGSLKSDLDSEESDDDELINDNNLDGVSNEIDLTSDTNNREFTNHFARYPKLEKYRSKYRNLVHLNRDLIVKRDELNRVILDINNRSLEKTIELKNQIKNLSMQLQALQECQETKTQTASQTSPNIDSNKTQTLPTHNDKEHTASINTNTPHEKSNNKIRDLEHLLAKCKESLKAKNGRIDQLEQNLKELDSLKEENISLKSDVTKLKQQHEDWTVSIAESKRSVHEELETRTAQLNTLKSEYNDLSRRSQESSAVLKQQAYRITDLEGQIVRMNSVHQQEKVDLKKEHEKSERNALMQINQEHERKFANQKLDFQKIIDSMKNDIAKKDEDLLKSSGQIKVLEAEVESFKAQLEKLSCAEKQQSEEHSKLLEKFDKCEEDSRQKIAELQKRVESNCTELETVSNELKAAEITNQELSDKLKALENAHVTPIECQACPQIKLDAQKLAEESQQEIYELNSKVTVLSSAIEDQEKEIKQLRLERDSINNENQKLNIEFDELTKKNESLSRVIQDTETDIQNQQEQLDELVNCKQELANLKKTNNSQNKESEKLNSMLGEKNEHINKLSERKEAILNDFKDAKSENEKLVKIINSLQNEKDILKSNHDKLSKEFSYNNQNMVACILNTMKNLESPGVSPSSDEANCLSDDQSSSAEDLPKSCVLMEQLSRLAVERCNAYMTATQRLEASILENKALLSETDHLKEELDRLNSERKEYLASSTQEAENLREENQILNNDYQSMSESLAQCEEEIAHLKGELQSFVDNAEKTDATIKLYKEKLLEFEENQVITEERIKEYVNELNSLGQLKDTYEKQLSETSSSHTLHVLRIKELESKFEALVSNYETKCQNLSQRISEGESTIAKLQVSSTKEKPSSSTTDTNIKSEKLEELQQKLDELQIDILNRTEAFDVEKKYFTDTINSLKEELTTEKNRTISNDHNYQIGALQRVIQQYQ